MLNSAQKKIRAELKFQMKPNFTKKTYYYGEISYIYNPALEIKLYYILIILLDPNIRLFHARSFCSEIESIFPLNLSNFLSSIFAEVFFAWMQNLRWNTKWAVEHAKCRIIAQLFFHSAGNPCLTKGVILKYHGFM